MEQHAKKFRFSSIVLNLAAAAFIVWGVFIDDQSGVEVLGYAFLALGSAALAFSHVKETRRRGFDAYRREEPLGPKGRLARSRRRVMPGWDRSSSSTRLSCGG